MHPKSKETAWAHCDVIDGKMICKYCHNPLKGGINRFKQHLAGIGGNAKPTNEVIGHIRAKYLQRFETQVTEPIEEFVTAKFGSRDSTN